MNRFVKFCDKFRDTDFELYEIRAITYKTPLNIASSKCFVQAQKFLHLTIKPSQSLFFSLHVLVNNKNITNKNFS